MTQLAYLVLKLLFGILKYLDTCSFVCQGSSTKRQRSDLCHTMWSSSQAAICYYQFYRNPDTWLAQWHN